MTQRNWSSLGEAQRKRYLGWGRKQGWSPARVERYYNEGGSLKQARGKPANEYQVRKTREKARAGKWAPLTPAQIRWLREQGATDGDLRMAQEIPQKQVRDMIREQKQNVREYDKHPATYHTDWSPEEWKDAHGNAPEVFYYYHGASVFR